MSSPNPTVRSARDKNGASAERFKTLAALFGALAALFALITAALGVFSSHQTSQKERAQDESAQLQQQIASLNLTISKLEQRLNAQTTTSENSSASVGDVTSDATFTRELTLTLDPSNENDYDSIDVANGKVLKNNGGYPIYYTQQSGQFRLQPNGPMSLPISGPVDRAACKSAVDTRPTSSPITKLAVGLKFCASEGESVALFRVVAAPTRNGTLVLSETYWE